jgi:predicted dehydrogenase
MSTSTTRWGILGPGRIAHSFARDLRHVPGARLEAVASRAPERAAAFAAEHGGRASSSYADLVADADVDIVYVASPHSHHLEHGRLALEAGKPVLVEKPLTLDAAQAEELVALARERGLFLMEAMWTACHPVVRALVAGLAEGRWGTPRLVHADLGFVVDAPPTDRLVDPALGAGALLDMGIYPLTFAHLVLGEAEALVAVADVTDAGVDRDIAIAGRHPGGAVSALTASMTSRSPRVATIATSQGRIEVPAPFHHPAYAVFVDADGEAHRIDGAEPILGSGLGNEAAHVQDCLAAGRLESPLVPHAQTLTLMRQMDDLRAQVGAAGTSPRG